VKNQNWWLLIVGCVYCVVVTRIIVIARRKNKMVEKVKKVSHISMGLGIFGLAIGWAIPVIGVLFGLIGLAVKKNNYDVDIALNTLSLVFGVLAWMIYFYYGGF
jgi:hypothetical protein